MGHATCAAAALCWSHHLLSYRSAVVALLNWRSLKLMCALGADKVNRPAIVAVAGAVVALVSVVASSSVRTVPLDAAYLLLHGLLLICLSGSLGFAPLHSDSPPTWYLFLKVYR
jgi:hypothetical protein